MIRAMVVVPFLPLVPLEALRGLHFINGNSKAPGSRPVDDRNKPSEEEERDGVIDVAFNPRHLLEVPPDIRFGGYPPDRRLCELEFAGIVCLVIGAERCSKSGVHPADPREPRLDLPLRCGFQRPVVGSFRVQCREALLYGKEPVIDNGLDRVFLSAGAEVCADLLVYPPELVERCRR